MFAVNELLQITQTFIEKGSEKRWKKNDDDGKRVRRTKKVKKKETYTKV